MVIPEQKIKRPRKPQNAQTNKATNEPEKPKTQEGATKFLKDHFKGPAYIFDPKTGQRIQQVAKKQESL